MATVVAAIGFAGLKDCRNFTRPQPRFNRQIDKTGAGNFHASYTIALYQLVGKKSGQIARFHAHLFRQHHGRITGKVAMAHIARQLKHNLTHVQSSLQQAIPLKVIKDTFKR